MADRFWVGASGNWSDNTNHWSASSGGAPNASKPTSADPCYFDANSGFTGADKTVTLDEYATCAGMDWTGAPNSPILAMSASGFNFYGSVTLIAAMSITGGDAWQFQGGSCNVTTNGKSPTCITYINGGTVTFLDAFNDGTNGLTLNAGTLNSNGMAVTLGDFNLAGAGAKTLTMGASALGCTSFNYSGSNLTVTANTGTITVSGTGVFAGGAIATYNAISLTGTSHTISGAFTCASLTCNTTGACTMSNGITVTGATTLTAGTLALSTYDYTMGTFDISNANVRAVTGSGTVTLNSTGNGVTKWNAATTTNLTWSFTGTLVLDNASVFTQTFAGGGLTYPAVTLQGGAGHVIISGNNTFTTLTDDRSGAAKTIKNTDGSTQTITNFLCPVSGTTLVTLTGTGAAGWTWTKAGGGIVSLDYLVVNYGTFTPPNVWYFGEHSYITAGTVTDGIFGAPGSASKTMFSSVIV